MLACMQIQAQERWSLRQCIDYAIEHNIDIRQTANEAEQNKISVNTAKWARLPNLNGGISQGWSWGRTASPKDNSYSDTNSSSTGVNLSTNVPLFTGLQLSNQYSLAKLNLQAAIEDLNKAKEDIAINVTSAYLQVLFNLELNKVAQNEVELSKDQLKRIKGLHDVGKASPAEVAEAQARVAQDEMTAVQADNTYKLSLLSLSQLLELPTPEGFVLENPKEELKFEPLTAPDDIYIQAIAYKPGIKAAEYRLQGSLKNIRIAQSEFYPQLSFSAGLGSSYYTLNGEAESGFARQLKNNLSKSISFNLSVPIFNRFSTRNRVRTARLQQSNLALQLDNAKKVLYKEIQQAYYNATAAQEKYTASDKSVLASKEAFSYAEDRYAAGKSTVFEYSEAKTKYAQSLSEQAQAKYDFIFRTKILDFYNGTPITL